MFLTAIKDPDIVLVYICMLLKIDSKQLFQPHIMKQLRHISSIKDHRVQNKPADLYPSNRTIMNIKQVLLLFLSYAAAQSVAVANQAQDQAQQVQNVNQAQQVQNVNQAQAAQNVNQAQDTYQNYNQAQQAQNINQAQQAQNINQAQRQQNVNQAQRYYNNNNDNYDSQYDSQYNNNSNYDNSNYQNTPRFTGQYAQQYYSATGINQSQVAANRQARASAISSFIMANGGPGAVPTEVIHAALSSAYVAHSAEINQRRASASAFMATQTQINTASVAQAVSAYAATATGKPKKANIFARFKLKKKAKTSFTPTDGSAAPADATPSSPGMKKGFKDFFKKLQLKAQKSSAVAEATPTASA